MRADLGFEFKDQTLNNLIKLFKIQPPTARVGILGTSPRANGKSTNTKIGIKHEFGDGNLPQRSFLRVPIADNLENYLVKAGAFDKRTTIKDAIKSRNLLPWVTKMAIMAVQIVNEAFDSGGFGKWKPSDMRFKKNHQTLVETQQLRNSVTWDVK